MTSTRVQLWCVWCGPAFITLFFTGMLVADLLPPPDPSWSAQQTADFWREDPDMRLFGLALMMASTTLIGPFVCAITMQLRRIKGSAPANLMQLVGGGSGVLTVVLPTLFMASIAFRPGRDPEITQAMTDLALIPFIVNWPPAVIQAVGLGVAVLQGRDDANPVLPRWLGYYSLWTAFLFLPGTLLLLFKDGAWAWDGVLSFWLVAVLFGVWQLVVFVQVRKAILAEAAAGSGAQAAPPVDVTEREVVGV